METAIAQKAAVFEKLRLRNMSTSRLALRSKTLEANDLENALAVSSASRFIPQAYTVRRPDGSYSATPNTGRISIQAERANLEQLISGSSDVIDALRAEPGESAAFIKNFARQTSLVDIPSTVHPTYLAFDIGSLRDMFYGEEPSVRLVRKQGEKFVELKKAAANVVLNALDRHFSIGHDGDDYPILNPEDGIPTGKVSIGKTRISLPGFTRTSSRTSTLRMYRAMPAPSRSGGSWIKKISSSCSSVISLSPTSTEHSSETMRFSPAAQRLWRICRRHPYWKMQLAKRAIRSGSNRIRRGVCISGGR